MFILVLGISIQNAYMWSVMDIPHLQKHAFAYMVLFIGTGNASVRNEIVSYFIIHNHY